MPKQRKAPPHTFWRNGVLWGRQKIKSHDRKWSLRTDDIEIARARVKAERERQIAAAYYGDDRKLFEEVADAWADHHIADQVGPRTAARYATSLAMWAPWVEGRHIDEVDKAMMGNFVETRRAAGVSVATIRRDLTAMSSILKYAIAEDWRPEDDNPALMRLQRLKERRDPIVLPEPADIQFVIGRAPGRFAALVEAAWRTGCRLEELAGAERAKLDHTRRQLTVRGKGNKVRVIDLRAAYDVLRALPAHLRKPWLFWHADGEPYRNASSRFAAIVKAAAVAARKEGRQFRPFRFHDLRHRFAVDYLKAGGSIYTLSQHMGHGSVATTEIYLKHLSPEEARAVKQPGPHQAEQQGSA